jgi:plastocyanin
MKTSNIIWIVVLALVILGGWYLYSAQTVSAPVAPLVETKTTTGTNAGANVSAPTAASSAPMSATVKYTANGFSPDPVTIKQGGTVTFVSMDGSPMWVASNAHPSHLQYDGTSRAQHCPNTAGTAFDQCASGKSYSFKFLKIGDWNYHNHVNADDGGTIMVVQ